jgi:hypothetical protein
MNQGEKHLRALLRKIMFENINVFHGSDRQFDSFDMSKVGSGDGKALGGYGIYFSDSEEVSNRHFIKGGFVKQFQIKSGNYFNLDESLDEGTGNEILNRLIGNNVAENDLEQFQTDFINYIPDVTNKQVYDWLSQVLGGDMKASSFLNGMGYIGNKFIDKWDSSATNYVVFDTKYILNN